MWKPERMFFSHATKDKKITALFSKALDELDNDIDLYIAERNLVGIPLIEKLKNEILTCNGLILPWTKKTKNKKTSQIISFELGMAYILGLPIYMFCIGDNDIPWFYDKITDYKRIDELNNTNIQTLIKEINFDLFYHPIDIELSKTPIIRKDKDISRLKNSDVVQDDNSLLFKRGFKGTLQFKIINNQSKPEKDLRIAIIFPKCFKLIFDPGKMNAQDTTPRNEIFEMWKSPQTTFQFFSPSFPIRPMTFEIRLEINNVEKVTDNLKIQVSSNNIIGIKEKLIPLKIE